MKKIKEELLSTDLALWRKKGIFIVLLLLSLFPFFISYSTSKPDLEAGLWQLRHFIGVAVVQAIAQTALAWYILTNKVPNYVITSLVVVVVFFQLTFGLTVILISNA